MKASIYADGFNLYYGAVKDTPYRWLNIASMCPLLLPRDQGGSMRSIADGQSYKVPSTIDDPAIVAEIEDAVEIIGYGKK